MERNWSKENALVYTESHHIMPKSWWKEGNHYTVRLTGQEHYNAHLYLFKAFPEDGSASYAFMMMCRTGNPNHQRDYEVQAKQYAEAREIYSKKQSEKLLREWQGENHPWTGRHHTEEAKKKLSLKNKGKTLSEVARSNMRGKRRLRTCPHCGLIGGGGNMGRYHFDNCKRLQLNEL
jgi:hypothetical protein